jgi:hypothetical protein
VFPVQVGRTLAMDGSLRLTGRSAKGLRRIDPVRPVRHRSGRFCLDSSRLRRGSLGPRRRRDRRLRLEADAADGASLRDRNGPGHAALRSRRRIDSPFAGPTFQKVASFSCFGQTGKRGRSGDLAPARRAAHAPIIGADFSGDVRLAVRTPHPRVPCVVQASGLQKPLRKHHKIESTTGHCDEGRAANYAHISI